MFIHQIIAFLLIYKSYGILANHYYHSSGTTTFDTEAPESLAENVVVEPLLTPLLLQELNPLLLVAISQTLTSLDVQVPLQKIQIPLMPQPLKLTIDSLTLHDIQWTDASGLFFKDHQLGFHGRLNGFLKLKYHTNSRLILPSGGMTIRLTGVQIDSALSLGYNAQTKVLDPAFKQLDIDVDDVHVVFHF